MIRGDREGRAVTYTNESRTPQAAIASRRMARRLLSGAGCASLTAYRLDADASAQLVLHALDVTGSIIVAAHPATDHPMAEVPCESPIEVRLDVALEAAEPGLRITTAFMPFEQPQCTFYARDTQWLMGPGALDICDPFGIGMIFEGERPLRVENLELSREY